MLKFYASAFCCTIVEFDVMGNHYHFITQMDKQRKLSPAELRRRAEILYSESYINSHFLKQEDWDKFELRLFDLSKLLHVLDGEFAKWFNKTHDRRGAFWASRFQSNILATLKDVQNCMMYVNLNPVRAKIVQRPEDYEGSGIYLRDKGRADWLMDLGEIFGKTKSERMLLKEYRYRLYYRGDVQDMRGPIKIPKRIREMEIAAGYPTPGVYLDQFAYFVRGLILGPANFILQMIKKQDIQKLHKRPITPVQPDNCPNFILNKPRETG
ncbi:MAG: hypothetical protein GY841_05315 [FCB group bacterium]|nr:hypothetical protein [FCB group bacterium]